MKLPWLFSFTPVQVFLTPGWALRVKECCRGGLRPCTCSQGAGAEERGQGEAIGCKYNWCLSAASKLAQGYKNLGGILTALVTKYRNRCFWLGKFSLPPTLSCINASHIETCVRAGVWLLELS